MAGKVDVLRVLDGKSRKFYRDMFSKYTFYGRTQT